MSCILLAGVAFPFRTQGSTKQLRDGCKVETRTINGKRVKDCFCAPQVIPPSPKASPDPCAQVCQTLGAGSTGCQTCKQNTTPKTNPSTSTPTAEYTACCTRVRNSDNCKSNSGKGSYYEYSGRVPKGIKCPTSANRVQCPDNMFVPTSANKGTLITGSTQCRAGSGGGGGDLVLTRTILEGCMDKYQTTTRAIANPNSTGTCKYNEEKFLGSASFGKCTLKNPLTGNCITWDSSGVCCQAYQESLINQAGDSWCRNQNLKNSDGSPLDKSKYSITCETSCSGGTFGVHVAFGGKPTPIDLGQLGCGSAAFNSKADHNIQINSASCCAVPIVSK